MNEQDLKQAKEEAAKLLLNPNGNIVGIGIGKKIKGGNETQEDCVRVYVVKKIVPNYLGPESLAPLNFLGVPTDVIEVERFGRNGHPPPKQEDQDTTPRPGSPIRLKTSAPNVNAGLTGTLGAVVTDGARQYYILSCNHVLAVNGRAKEVEIVSAAFVGTQDMIAEAVYFIELKRDAANPVDCAVALLPTTPTTKVQATFPHGLALSQDGPADPEPGMNVTKFGAATSRTYGKIVDIDADLYIDYSFGTFRFNNQVLIDGGTDNGHFAIAGDSGSLAIDTSTNRATAMIFAESGRFAVACPLKMVLEKLAAEVGVAKLYIVAEQVAPAKETVVTPRSLKQ